MASVLDEIVQRQMAAMPLRQPNPEGSVTQGNWLDFNPVIKNMLGGLSEMLGTAPSARLMKRLQDVQSPLIRPQSGFEWADWGAGTLAEGAQTALAGADLAAMAPLLAKGYMGAGNALGQSGQVDVWHGSPHKFDKFSLEKVGTGEGNQSFGWGGYFTNEEDIANYYKEQLSTNVRRLKLIASPYEGETPEYAVKKLRQAAKQAEYNGRKWDAREYEETASWIESGKPEQFSSGATYRAQLFPGKDPSEYTFLDWYEPVKQSKFKEVLDLAYKEFGPESPVVDQLMKINPVVREINGNGLYQTIAAQLGKGGRDVNGQREASLFLKRAGIDGIRYPTETLSGKGPKGGGAYNYVVFDENDVRLVSRESGGVVEDILKAQNK